MASERFIAVTGGVGGAKLALGLTQLLSPDEIAFIVNTGDDFEHLGLHVSPDIDTLVYTLSGQSNTEAGWGRRGETWQFMHALKQFGGEAWFNLGDLDLAMHVERTQRLRKGATLTEVTKQLGTALGVQYRVLPMSDAPVRTMIGTANGELAFQHYFVRDRCAPAVTGFRFAGSAAAAPTRQIEDRFDDPDLAGVIICPSNPFVSVDPVLAVPGMREGLKRRRVPIVAVSPIVAGTAIKGPTAKMMSELSIPNDAVSVARHYRGLIDGFVMDHQDAALENAVGALGIATVVTQTVMLSLADRRQLAADVLQFFRRLKSA
jgi:LPPG:FO 2-phospho-L-lactate transferase